MSKQGQMDLELKKAFGELQQKMVETSQKLKLADLQIETLKRSMTHAQLTDKEISQLPTDTKTYESVGRMFVLKEVTEARMNLDNKIKGCEEKVKTLEGTKAYLERSLKESENNIREMIQQRKDANVGDQN
ncbi:prefoldin subunit 1-like [Daphnia carinata]|uniref:prefoldin subunit 1-like n=1 Tax=Daphnia carinata TaxID=120202 RepID=UPI002580D9D8|nr:prefoldin subunit 1-like [Daphnia carinata]